jgi:hypothetical protein
MYGPLGLHCAIRATKRILAAISHPMPKFMPCGEPLAALNRRAVYSNDCAIGRADDVRLAPGKRLAGYECAARIGDCVDIQVRGLGYTKLL